MTQDTLTITNTTCNYIDGFINVQMFTLETCLLDMLYTSTKPRRKAVFLTDERPRKVHHYTYTMSDVHRMPEAAGIPSTVHSFTLRFPELSDCFYYTALQPGVPDDGNPQSPIQAWRLPLTPVFIELWPESSIPPAWLVTDAPPESTITQTPGRATMRNEAAPFSDTELALIPSSSMVPLPPTDSHLFVLYDSVYVPITQDDASLYLINLWFEAADHSYVKHTFIYGDINVDPCTTLGPGFLGNFQPHIPHLFCTDLYRLPLADLCGNTLPSGSPTQFFFWQVLVANIAAPATGVPSVVAIRPFAIYNQTGDFIFLGRRWPYIRPLLPQTSSPALTQK